MNSLGLSLLQCAVQVILFSAATAVVYGVARRVSPRAAVNSLLVGLSFVLALSLLAGSPWPRWQLSAARSGGADATHPPEAAGANASLTAGNDANEPMPNVDAASSSFEATRPTLAELSAAFFAALAEAPTIESNQEAAWPAWLAIFVVAGALLASVRLALGLYGVRRLLRHSREVDEPRLNRAFDLAKRNSRLQAAVGLCETSQISTPATVGWLTPTVILPNVWRDWTDDELQAVLAHEFAHVAHRDFSAWVVARLAVALHFYNPLVLWLASRLQLEQELAADASAAEAVSDKKRYLRLLASLALATPSHRLSGPARTFIPSRSLLMRRVEMLRSPLSSVSNRIVATRLQWAAGCLLAVLAVAVAGLRLPTPAQAQQPAGNVAVDATQAPDQASLVELTPEGAVFALLVRPAEIFSRESFKPLAEQINSVAPPLESTGVGVRDFAAVMVAGRPDRGQPRIVVRMTTEEACDRFAAALTQRSSMRELVGAPLPTWRDASEQVARFDSATLVIDHYATTPSGSPPPLRNTPPRWAKAWAERSDRQLLAALDNAKLRDSMPDAAREQLLGGMPMQMVAPLLDQIEAVVAGIRFGDDLQLDVNAKAGSEPAAQQVAATVKALMTLAGNALKQQTLALKDAPPEVSFQLEKTFALTDDFLAHSQVEVDGDKVELTYRGNDRTDQTAVTAALVLPAVQSAREAARRVQSINNLKQLALAMHNYASAYKSFPAAVNYDYRDQATGRQKRSEHPHSWRVALLPFLEDKALYDAYRFDEPWDSGANKQVLAEMPDVFRDPSDSGAATNASYFVLTGANALFAGDEPVGFAEITDGMSNTLMIVEARRDIPWTKPADIFVEENKALPKLGGSHPGIFLAAFADGSVRTIAEAIDPSVLRALITRSGGEVIPGGF